MKSVKKVAKSSKPQSSLIVKINRVAIEKRIAPTLARSGDPSFSPFCPNYTTNA